MIQQSKKTTELLLQYLLLAVIFSAGFFGYLMKTSDWFQAIPGDIFDARFNSIILEHLLQWLKGETPKLWSPAFFYPFENVLAFSDNHFGSGWSYVLFRISGLEREYAFLGWIIVGNLLNFCVSYYVYRKLGFSIVASGVGAFVFTFALPALAQEAHAQLTYRFAVPLSFFALWQFIQTQKICAFVRVIFWLTVQFLCSIYLGVFLIYLLGIFTLVWLVSKKGVTSIFWKNFQSNSKPVIYLGIILIVLFLGTIFALLYKYQTVSMTYGFNRSVTEIQSMMPRLSSYLIADSSALTGWIGESLSTTPMRHEHQMFFGLGLCIVGLVGIGYLYKVVASRYIQTQELARISAWTLLSLIALTISINGYSIYRLVLYIPGISSVRAVSRIVLIMLLPVGLLAATAVDGVQQYLKKASSRWISLIILVLLVISETIFYQPYSTGMNKWLERKEQLKALMPRSELKESIIYVSGNADDPHYKAIELDAMIVSQDMHLSTLNGYSGSNPPGYIDPLPCISFQNRLNGFLDLFKKSNIDAVSLVKRVVVIPFVACPVTPMVATNKTIDFQIASKINLNTQLRVIPPLLSVTVSIHNTSEEKFSTLSRKGPIRLSWRFIPIGTDGQLKEAPEWITRKDLYFELEKDQKDVESFNIPLPAKKGRYQFEVSMVQDGVAWFHDLGMMISRHYIDAH